MPAGLEKGTHPKEFSPTGFPQQSLGPRPGTDQRPHILYLIDMFTGVQAGGAERALVSIAHHLPTDRFRCSVATFGTDPSLNLAELFNCPVHVLPLRRTYDWNALKMAIQLRKLIRSEQVSILHTFFETSDLWGGTVAKLSGCPLLVSSRRDMGILRKPKHGIAYRLSKPYVDLVLTVSDQVRSFMIERDGLDPRKVVTLYSGVEMERFAKPCNTVELRSSLGLQKASHVVCTVGNIRQVKGLDVYIRAAAQVCRVFPRAVFLIVGYRDDEAHAKELERLVRELGLSENVRFLGGHEEVHPLLKLSDAFCLLSRSEGFSMALLEAMACGLPCVATRVGGNAEAIEEGRSGFLVEAEDAKAAAERILWLLRNSERSAKMGAAGRKVVERRFTVDVMVQNLVHVYDHLLQGKES